MELNILKLVLDRAGRITNSQNLSLNQCSSNNRLKVYYEGEYDYIECSFRKPDGWLSDKLTLTFDVDEELYNYAYVDIPEDFVTFPMGGRNAILVGNLYLHKGGIVASLGNIGINVNYVDDSLVHTNYSENYMANINSQIGALQNDLNRFKTGDVLVGKAISDRKGNTIDIYYETKADALDKYDDLNQKKLDKSEVQDQTTRLELLENNATNVQNLITNIEKVNTAQSNSISSQSEDIDNLKNNKVSLEEFSKESEERIAKENDLQKQIDDLSSTSNVKDMVGSYTDLLNYNTSKLEIGDRILVTTDKTQGEVSTVYRWTENGWEFVGKYASSSYTKTETDKKLNDLKATIPNRIETSNNQIYLSKDGNKIEQSTPVSFKSINGESIIGTGNISTDNTDNQLSSTSERPVQNKVITAALENKATLLQLSQVKDELVVDIRNKQNKLKAGSNITITEDGTISVSSAISFRKVDVLPETGDTNIIYLLKTTQTDYTEYIWLDGKWETLGDATINLDNYLTAKETRELLADKAAQTDLDSLSSRVSANTVELAGKADANTTNTSISLLNSSVSTLNTAIANKVDSETLENYALKEEIPDVSLKQDKLVSGENIKTINGVNILGYGDLLIANTEIVDLGNYLLKTDANELLSTKADKTELFDLDYTKLNNKPNLEIFATEDEMATYVAQEISKIPPTDLSNYYTKEEVDTAITTHTPDLTGYATENYVRTEINAILDNAPDAYNTLKEIADYITSDKSSAASMLASINQNAGKIDLNTQYIDRLDTKLDQTIASYVVEFANRYTKDEVNSLLDGKLDTTTFKTINGQSITGTGNIQLTANLDNYYTKPQVDNFLSKKSTVKANPGTGTTSLSTVTIDGIDYLVRPDMNNYYTKNEVDSAISNIHIDLTGYATQEYVDNQIREEFSTILNAAPEAYDTFKEIADYIESDLSNTAAMLASINNKADKSEAYTKVEANAKFAEKSEIPVLPDMTKYYTKEETVEVIDKVSGLDNYYEKTEVDAALLNKQDMLISGSTIKTINGESVLGMGDLDLSLVVANPVLDGGEAILESIQIEDTKYSLQGQDMIFSETTSQNPDRKVLKTISIENEDWIVEKGSVVTPNVELNGTEPVLESVQIDENVFTLKGEEMIFSETAVEGATALRNIRLGVDNWGIPDPDLTNYYTKTEIDSQLGSKANSVDVYTKSEIDEQFSNEITFSEEAKDGHNLKSITVGTTVWSVGGVSKSYVDQKVADLVNSAPETLDTLGELAAALQENSSLIDTLNTLINQKANKNEVPNIVYSETEPENPVEGMIWLKKI